MNGWIIGWVAFGTVAGWFSLGWVAYRMDLRRWRYKGDVTRSERANLRSYIPQGPFSLMSSISLYVKSTREFYDKVKSKNQFDVVAKKIERKAISMHIHRASDKWHGGENGVLKYRECKCGAKKTIRKRGTINGWTGKGSEFPTTVTSGEWPAPARGWVSAEEMAKSLPLAKSSVSYETYEDEDISAEKEDTW